MKRVQQFLIHVYPATWRRRYGRELEALLEDSSSGWYDAADLFRAAMEVQMKTWSFGRIVTVCGIAGLLLAAVAIFSMPVRYQSTAMLKTTPTGSTDYWRALTAEAFTPQTLSDIIDREHLYENTPRADSINRLRRGIRIESVGSDRTQLSFAYEDPGATQRISQELVGKLIAANLTTSAVKANDGSVPGTRIELVQPADPPRKQIAKLGKASFPFPLSLLFGVALALILRRRVPTAS